MGYFGSAPFVGVKFGSSSVSKIYFGSTLAWQPSAPNDPNFGNVKLLLHGEGANGSTTATDSSSYALTMTPSGSAKIGTAQFKFGAASLDFNSGTNGAFTAPQSSCTVAANENYTIEAWIYPTAIFNGGAVGILEFAGSNAGTRISLALGRTGTRNTIAVNYNFSTSIVYHQGTVNLNEWTHIAMVRSSNVTHTYINGIKSTTGFNHSSALDNNSTLSLNIGPRQLGDQNKFYLDEVRLTVGLARYTADFVPPTTAFPDS